MPSVRRQFNFNRILMLDTTVMGLLIFVSLMYLNETCFKCDHTKEFLFI